MDRVLQVRVASLLPAASFRETEPHPQSGCTAHASHRHERVVKAVALLVTCNGASLTAAARQVLLEEPTTHGERWVMQVIKAAFRNAVMGHERGDIALIS